MCVLDSSTASDLAAAVAKECDGHLVDVCVIAWGGAGACLGSATTASLDEQQVSRMHLAAEFAAMAVTRRGDVMEVPPRWAARQSAPHNAPELVGAAVTVCLVNDGAQQSVTPVGVVGLLGIASEVALRVLRDTIAGHGFALMDSPDIGER